MDTPKDNHFLLVTSLGFINHESEIAQIKKFRALTTVFMPYIIYTLLIQHTL